MKNVLFPSIFILSIILLISGCQFDIGNEMDDHAIQGDLVKGDIAIAEGKIIRDVGIIRYINLEGGFYGIIGKKGKYDPVNLPKIFQYDGLKVEFTAKCVNDMGSIHMWGKLIRLITMVTLEAERPRVMDEGIVDQVYIQGSPWIIRGSTGTYQPINLPDEFLVKGLKVRFNGTIRKDIVIIPPLWPILEIAEIERIEEKPIIVNLDQRFKLPVRMSALVPRHEVLLTFKSVLSDSRCPIGVICVWEGEAVILVNVKIRGRDYGDFKMTTRDRPSVINVGPYYIQFFDLYPYPVYGVPVDPASYVGTFLIGSALEEVP